jgi:hypothetical protein
MAGITHDSHARQTRGSFPERFEPLGGKLIRQECHAGGITARLSQACRKAEQHRIWAHGIDNRNRLRRLRNMRSDVAAERKNHVGLAAHQIRGEFRKPLRPTLRKAILKRDVQSVNVTKLAKAFHESLCIRILVGCAVNQDADTKAACRLLCICPFHRHKGGHSCKEFSSAHIEPPRSHWMMYRFARQF